MGNIQHIFTVTQTNDKKTLLVFLRKCGVSSTYIKKVKNTPVGIMVNGIRQHTNFLLQTGDIISLPLLPQQEQLSALPENLPFDILYKSEYALVCEKPAFQTIHNTLNHKSGTMANAFSNYIKDNKDKVQFRPVYRLDRNTTGLMLLSMNGLSTPFLAKSAQKMYYAIVGGNLAESGVVNAPIALEKDSIIKHCVDYQNGKTAKTFYDIVWANDEYSLVKLHLETGRTHQIRVHMAYIGHPLLGDDLYGGDCQKISRHALHCARLTFEQPDKKVVDIKSSLPEDMQKLVPFMGENNK